MLYACLKGGASLDFIQRIAQWNKRMNNLPRRLLLVVATLFVSVLGLLVLPYVWPFAAAFLFSRILEPFVHMASKGFSRCRPPSHRSRCIATVLGMLLLFGLAGALVTALISWLFQELSGFLKTLPQLFQWMNDHALPAVRNLYSRYRALLPTYIPELIENAFSSLGQNALSWAGSLSAWLTSGAWSTAASIPHVLLSIVLTLMGTYYITADRSRIAAFFQRTFPRPLMQRSRIIRTNLLLALLGQVRSQLMVSLVVMFFLMVTLGFTNVRYGVIIGMLIGIADALPVLGAGVFLIPWSLMSFLTGHNGMGITLACLYAGAILIRQILEPRLVGKHLGLYPLATMIAMYAGYRLMGFLGLLAGPILLNAAKAVLEADLSVTQDQHSAHR